MSLITKASFEELDLKILSTRYCLRLFLKELNSCNILSTMKIQLTIIGIGTTHLSYILINDSVYCRNRYLKKYLDKSYEKFEGDIDEEYFKYVNNKDSNSFSMPIATKQEFEDLDKLILEMRRSLRVVLSDVISRRNIVDNMLITLNTNGNCSYLSYLNLHDDKEYLRKYLDTTSEVLDESVDLSYFKYVNNNNNNNN